jgi:hypothetical protein
MFCVHLVGLVKESKLIKMHGVNNLQKKIESVCLGLYSIISRSGKRDKGAVILSSSLASRYVPSTLQAVLVI